jgi:hypothetical protein
MGDSSSYKKTVNPLLAESSALQPRPQTLETIHAIPVFFLPKHCTLGTEAMIARNGLAESADGAGRWESKSCR